MSKIDQMTREIGVYLMVSASDLSYDDDRLTREDTDKIFDVMGLSLLGGGDWEAPNPFSKVYLDDVNLEALSGLGVRGVLTGSCDTSGDTSGDTVCVILNGDGTYDDADLVPMTRSDRNAVREALMLAHEAATMDLQHGEEESRELVNQYAKTAEIFGLILDTQHEDER